MGMGMGIGIGRLRRGGIEIEVDGLSWLVELKPELRSYVSGCWMLVHTEVGILNLDEARRGVDRFNILSLDEHTYVPGRYIEMYNDLLPSGFRRRSTRKFSTDVELDSSISFAQIWMAII